MARTMRKFSAGGAQGKYDRRMADIEKDRKIALAKGKNADVVEAKAAQRKADAEDDRAKRMGLDRTATRAAERLAESNLTKTRKYGAPKAVTTEAPTSQTKITESLSLPKMDSSIGAKPVMATKPTTVTRSISKPTAADTSRGKFSQDSLAKTDFKSAARMAEKPIAASKFDSKAFADLKAKATPTKTVTTTGGTALRGKPGGTPLIRFGRDVANDPARKAKLAEMKRAAEAPGASAWAKGRYKDALSSDMYAKGGKVKKKEKVMKYAKGGSTPPQPTPADRARSKKHLDELKKLKPTDAEGKAVGSANRSSGYAKGGKVKKMAVGGMAPNTPTTPNTAAPAANTAAPAANTAARATTTPNTVGPGMSATTQGTDAQRRAQNAQAILQAKYSSATPNKDASNRTQQTTNAAGNMTSNKVVNQFDRNQALRDFSTVSSNFLKQGVPLKELTRASGELRKLQLDNKSTPAQHQAAIQSILARMNSLVPKKVAKGGSMKAAKKFASGGLVGGHKAANGIAKKGLTKGKQVKMSKGGACYAKGGSVRGIDGIATKGKTRCKGARK